MVGCSQAILDAIPHRPPFLWVDRIISMENDSIETEKEIPIDLDLFKGHYPEYPIMPGVILCEALFQTGGLLISDILSRNRSTESGDDSKQGVPVLTRILGAKFKREVRPGDTIRMNVRLKETLGPAWFLKGKVLVRDKTAVKVNFACTITTPSKLSPVS